MFTHLNELLLSLLDLQAEMNAALGTELKDQNPKPSQQTKGMFISLFVLP